MPSQSIQPQQTIDTGHMPPEHHRRSSIGPVVGIVVILLLMAFGALYFYGAYLNRQNSSEQLPFIPADNSTQQPQ